MLLPPPFPSTKTLVLLALALAALVFALSLRSFVVPAPPLPELVSNLKESPPVKPGPQNHKEQPTKADFGNDLKPSPGGPFGHWDPTFCPTFRPGVQQAKLCVVQ
jgi:hypothetical protein